MDRTGFEPASSGGEPDSLPLTYRPKYTEAKSLYQKFSIFKFLKLKPLVSLILLFSLILHSLFIIPASVYAASTPWSQTNWNGGSGQTSWSDTTKYDSSSNVTTSTANQVTLTATSSWYNAAWAYRKKITFDNSAQAENLTNFPVLVKLDSTRINYSNTQDSGQDIRFTDSDGTTLLSYEIEKWDETGSSFVWVKVPQVDASSSTDYIYVYYGNSSASDAQAATSVWDSNYVMVQHLAETSGTSTNDSTSNNNDGTKVSATEPNPTTSGQINGAQTFDGNNDRLTITGNAQTQLLTPFTHSIWILFQGKASSIPDGVSILLDNRDPYNDTKGWYWEASSISSTNGPDSVSIATHNGGATVSLSPRPGLNQWHQFTAASSGTSTKVYLDGVLQGTATNAYVSIASDDNVSLGEFLDGNTNVYGSIDETRLSNSARSAAWIAASYKSEANTFNTFASEEQQYPSSGTLTSSIFDTELSGGGAWGTLTYSVTTPSNTAASIKIRTSNSSSMTGATAFGSCTAISSGSDISSNSCVTDGNRYAQYLITLSNTDSTSTPTFTSYSLTWAAYDADAPSITLTALATDPNSDNTPTLSGTATDSIGTVSNVQFQMDATSGSWTACTASDGSFDEATETFTCTPSSLSDGSHTMYVRATDSNSNTTSSGSESSDTFTIDATKPVSIDLDSPGDNSYTSGDRPSYKWKATTDATAGLSKYVLEIDNPSLGSGQASGDFTIDSIPTSRTTDYETNKYTIHYENFSDSDSTNNYISVYTNSHSDWGSSENDGKLREGRVSWKVKAVDNAGNETSSSRTLFVDRTSPSVEFAQINNLSTSQESKATSEVSVSTTDKTPTIYGKITDPLAGADPVASGPKEVNIKVEKKNGLTYTLVTLYKINMDNPYYTCEEGKTIDNSKQKCDKYLPFEYTLKDALDFGTYKITLSGKDKADNPAPDGAGQVLTLNITTLSQITTPAEKKVIEEALRPAQGEKQLSPEEKEKIKQELEITKPTEEVPVSALEKILRQAQDKAGENISQTTSVILSGAKDLITTVLTSIRDSSGFALRMTTDGISFVFDKTVQDIAFRFNMTEQGLAFVGNGIGTGISNIAQGIGSGYNNIAYHAPGVSKNIMLAVGNGFNTTGNFIGTTANNIGTGVHNTGQAIAQEFNNTKTATQNGIANIAFGIGEKTDDVSHGLGTAIIKIGYLFVPEPTTISDVKITKLTSTSVIITWKTNHPATGKVNYGLTKDFGQDTQSTKRITDHEFTVTNLQPNTIYFYEVMSQNRNYVYDANHEFKTPKE